MRGFPMTPKQPVTKRRIDTLAVERGVVESREKAQALIMAGKLIVDGEAIAKPGTLVREGCAIQLVESPPFVSRGGFKLSHALDEFRLDVTSQIAVDVGASTGGFTDCLLQRGAARVYALDVGYGQLDYRLRRDPRVVVMERVNAHYPFSLPEQVNIATIDVSFISVEKVIPNVVTLLKPRPVGGDLVVLFKPQFEVGKGQVGKGGVVRQPLLHAQALGRFICWAIQQGLRICGLTPSPLTGAEGNREFLFWLKPVR